MLTFSQNATLVESKLTRCILYQAGHVARRNEDRISNVLTCSQLDNGVLMDLSQV